MSMNDRLVGMPLTPAEKQKAYRERKAGRQPAAPKLECPACGKIHKGARGVLCSRCWERLTPEGKAYRVERVQRSKAKRADANSDTGRAEVVGRQIKGESRSDDRFQNDRSDRPGGTAR